MVDSLQTSHVVPIAADFDQVYDQFRRLVSGKPLSPTTLVPFIMTAIQLAERVSKESGDKGAAKKALVLRLVERLIGDLPLSESVRDKLGDALDFVGPSIIDGLIAADHGELLEKGKKMWTKVTACCRK